MDAASTPSFGDRAFFTFLVLFAAFGEVGFLALSVGIGQFLAESVGHDSAGLAVANSILVAAMHAAMIGSGVAEVPRRSTPQGVFLRRARWIVGAYLVMLTAVALPARDWPASATEPAIPAACQPLVAARGWIQRACRPSSSSVRPGSLSRWSW